MASSPFSCIAKPIRSAKTPQSSLCSRTAVASFTPLGLLSFSASRTRAVTGPIPISIMALMSLSVFSIPVSSRRSFSDRNLDPIPSRWKGACWWVLGSTGFVGWDCRVCCCCWCDQCGFAVVVGLIGVGLMFTFLDSKFDVVAGFDVNVL
ncbi:hypothetical protein SO802_000067 [Lithocarpus litseifolius]|uniref:Uncharacterized protein n=1 Tax=Lithocarpus litseifolius TaxID=425828 RepID=A0AAW2DTX0_9ROSI